MNLPLFPHLFFPATATANALRVRGRPGGQRDGGNQDVPTCDPYELAYTRAHPYGTEKALGDARFPAHGREALCRLVAVSQGCARGERRIRTRVDSLLPSIREAKKIWRLNYLVVPTSAKWNQRHSHVCLA